MQRSGIFLLFVGACALALTLLLRQGSVAAAGDAKRLAAARQLVRQLALTDLSLWSEARYTRHPSQADHFSAFQNFPGALDHFPAGSIVGPAAPQRDTRLEFRSKESR